MACLFQAPAARGELGAVPRSPSADRFVLKGPQCCAPPVLDVGLLPWSPLRDALKGGQERIAIPAVRSVLDGAPPNDLSLLKGLQRLRILAVAPRPVGADPGLKSASRQPAGIAMSGLAHPQLLPVPQLREAGIEGHR